MAPEEPPVRDDEDPLVAHASRAPGAIVISRVPSSADATASDVVVDYINAAAADLLSRLLPAGAGPVPPGLVERPVGELLDTDAAEPAGLMSLQVARTGASRQGVWQVETTDGTLLAVEFVCVFVPPDRTHTTFTDITARQRLERERDESTFLLRLAFDASPDGFLVVLVRADPGGAREFLIEQANDTARALLPDLVVGAPIAPQDPLHRHIADVVPAALDAIGPVHGRREVSFDSGSVVYDYGAARISDDRVIVSFRDVSHTVRLQQQADRSARLASRARRLMYVALDSSPIAFMVNRVRRDAGGSVEGFTVQFVNEPAVPPGREVRDVVGGDLHDSYPRWRDNGVEAALVAAIDTQEVQRLPVDDVDPDGTVRHYDAILSPVDRDLVVSSFIDVSELRRTQRDLAEARDVALAASDAKSDFLATVTHELRTPLTTMVGATQLLLDTPLNADQRTLVQQQSDGARMLLALINDILDLSKIEAGRLELELLDTDVRDLVDRTVGMFRAPMSDKGLRLTCEVAGDVPAVILADPVRLQQILLNLLSNSLKFTATGSIGVDVALDELRGTTAVLRFQVRDTGIGIPATAVRGLFRPFSQATSSTSRVFGGTGLGLSIAQRLVGLMSGTIRIDSVEGEGTTVSFTVSAAVGKAPDRSDATAEPDHVADGTRVLLAEDNLVNRQLLTRMLERIGCRVTAVTNGVEAVQQAERGGFDLVLMDLRMPDMDGFEATGRIRELELAGTLEHRTTVLALTANATSDVVARATAAGMDGFLSKPISLAELRAATARWTATGHPST